MIWRRLVFLTTGVWLAAGLARAEDWPQFLGPRSNGTSSETNLLDSWPTEGPTMLWAKHIGTGYSAPSVRGERLVLHHRLADDEVIECLDATSGEPKWRYAYPSRFEDPYGYNNGPRGTPLLTTNRCYTLGAEGRLVCLDLASGGLVWERDSAKDWQVPEAFFGVGTSPVLDQGKLLVMIGGQTNAGMVALAASTGETLWESVGERNWSGKPMLGWPGQRTVVWKPWDKQASYATPVLATIDGRRLAFCLMRQGLVALSPETGEVFFSRWFRAQVEESVNAASPLVVDDQVLISAAYRRVGTILLRIRAEGRGFEESWNSTNLEAHWSTPVHRAGFVFGFSGRSESDSRLRCLELKTGRLVWDRDESWKRTAGRQPGTFGRGSLVLVDGKLLVLGEGGLLGLFLASEGQSKLLARWQVPQLGFPCWTAPVVSGGRAYLRSEDRLICLSIRR